MSYPPIKPREMRLTLDVVRDAIRHNPVVLLVTGRSMNSTSVRFHSLTPEAVDTAFATHYFYGDNSTKETRLMMVPFSLNGEE
jgi:hypothetical protein